METYRTEEEQVEALKRWWVENGRSTITAIIFALAVGFGWQGWQKYGIEKAQAASNAYQGMLQKYSQADVAGADELANQIKTDYAGSTYAQFAALHLARAAVEGGDLVAAESELRWAADKADKDSEVYRVAQLRLARVVAARGDAEGALGILDSTSPGSFQAAYQAVRGDILMQQGDKAAAKEAYSSALMLSSAGGEPVNTALLQEKLQALSPEPPQPVSVTGGMEAALPAESPAADGESSSAEEP
ncbi:YfgM family protein [Haliea sp. E17]|uniref:YfgM family protein n=1 Tax=Haliea sp. E17 TaxID=3401576 RepID=UPI003AADB4B0